MSLNPPAAAIAAAAFFAAIGSTAVSAQENCGSLYQRVMQAYQMQSPQYGQMLDYYNARCLSGASSQPAWDGQHHGYRYDQDRRGYDNDRPGYGGDRWRWGG
jgi:hypothetical protein